MLRFATLLALLAFSLHIQAQTLRQTAGPPGAQFFGVAEWQGGLWASGRSGGLFTRTGTAWETLPHGERVGTLYPMGNRLIGHIGSVVYSRAPDGDWAPIFTTNVAYVSQSADSLLVVDDDTLYISGDGQTWRTALHGRAIVTSDGQPTGGELFFIGSAVQAPDGAFWVTAFSTDSGTFFCSEDGASWVDVSEGIPDFAFASELIAAQDGSLFTEARGTVYRRGVGAPSWVEVMDGLPAGLSVQQFVESPTGLFLFGYASAPFLFQWNGGSWDAVSLPAGETLSKIAPAANGLYLMMATRLYTGNGDGSWTDIGDGVIASSATPFVVDSRVAAMGPDFWRATADGGASWQLVPFPAINAVYDVGTALIGTASDNVFRSEDGGQSWASANTGINVGPFHKRNLRDVVLAPDGSIYAGLLSSRAIKHQGGEIVGGVYRSTNSGQSWSLHGSGFPTNSNGFRAGVYQLVSTPTHVLAATQEGLIRLAHGGSVWESVSTPAAASVLALEALGNRVVLATYNELYLSEDAGASWVLFEDGLPDISFRRQLAVSDDAVYLLISPFVDSVAGLYRMTATGWEDTEVEIPTWVTWSRMVAQDDGLYLGSYNHGVWFADPDGTTTAHDPAIVPLQPVLGPPHPNPSSHSATLMLSWPRTANVRVEVFDMLGRRIATVFDGTVQTNQPVRVQVPTDRLPPGHYVVQAVGEDHRTHQRLAVSR